MSLDINSYTGALVFWCPDCGAQVDEMEDKCPNCDYDGVDGWEPSPPAIMEVY
jgi:predicted RNA-binding Zn-ribbon protein involved in translation (DUF1610 family)